MRINALLAATVSRAPVAQAGLVPSSGRGTATGQPRQVVGDLFTQGQWWKNLASSQAGGASLAGSDTAKAAQAYARQSGGVVSVANVPGGGSGTAVDQGSDRVGNANSGSNAGPTPASQAAASEATNNSEQASSATQAGQSSAQASNGGPATERRGAAQQAATGAKGIDGQPLSQAETLQIAELQQADTSVKAHEMAHVAAAGSYARSGANYQYATGPDGKQYAVAGEVNIDTSEERSPQATISKMQTVRAAALAPADPSPQDRNVAARASTEITKASQEQQMVELEQARKASSEAGRAQGAGQSTSGAAESGSAETGSPQDDQNTAAMATGNVGAARPSAEQRALASLMQGLTRSQPQLHLAV